MAEIDPKFREFINDLVDDKVLYQYNEGNYALQSLENCSMRSDVELNTKTLLMRETPYGENIMGFHDLNGFIYMGAAAWGDNEFPVFFLIYKVMAEYFVVVPPADEGNVYNPRTNRPIGTAGSDITELQRLAKEAEVEIDGTENVMDLCKKLVDSKKMEKYILDNNWLWA